jgi:hypothetical protein
VFVFEKELSWAPKHRYPGTYHWSRATIPKVLVSSYTFAVNELEKKSLEKFLSREHGFKTKPAKVD